MAGAKIVVIYPRPTDIDAFEKLYQEVHLPMAVENLGGKTRAVMTKVVDSPQGAAFHRIVEIHFPSMKALRACAASDGGKQTLAHATKISTGGAPIILIAEEEIFDFNTAHDETLFD